MLDHLELKGHKDHLAKELSLGQQQRIAILRSLMQPFELLLMDEPFSHLDDQSIEKALQLIKNECQTQHSSFLLTSLGLHYGLKSTELINL